MVIEIEIERSQLEIIVIVINYFSKIIATTLQCISHAFALNLDTEMLSLDTNSKPVNEPPSPKGTYVPALVGCTSDQWSR